MKPLAAFLKTNDFSRGRRRLDTEEDEDEQASATFPECRHFSSGHSICSSVMSVEITVPTAGKPLLDLFYLVLDKSWHRVIRHCQQNPIDAQYQSPENLETPLYLACQNRPPVRAIRYLLKAYPAAASLQNRNGDLPLHAACRNNASTEVLHELTRNHPSAACHNSPGGIPAQVLWNCRETTEDDRRISQQQRKQDETLYQTTFWQKMNVILEAVARHRQLMQGQATHTLYMLHAVVSLAGWGGCPNFLFAVFEYALQKYPKQVTQCDGLGRLPFHVALEPSGIHGPTVMDSNSSHHGSLHLRKCGPPREQQVIARLLALYPEAARLRDPNEPQGRYPLHTALANGHLWLDGVRELFDCAPEVITLPDPRSFGLLPFQQAAARAYSTRYAVDLDTIYCLLRAQPAVLEDQRRMNDKQTLQIHSASSIETDTDSCQSQDLDDRWDNEGSPSTEATKLKRESIRLSAAAIVTGGLLAFWFRKEGQAAMT